MPMTDIVEDVGKIVRLKSFKSIIFFGHTNILTQKIFMENSLGDQESHTLPDLIWPDNSWPVDSFPFRHPLQPLKTSSE